jgi:AmmeMemoRadiSam system protein A
MDGYIILAKEAVENNIINKKRIEPGKSVPIEGITDKAGVFVSITNHGKLRGCIGTIYPTQKNIALEVIRNAILASTNDNRFPKVIKHELPDLKYKVDILSEPQPIGSYKNLDPKNYGVVVKTPDGRCGVLLPDLPGINDGLEQMAVAKQKGGIAPDEECFLYRFEVERHE